MTEIRFYHLTRSSLETALPVMLERTLERKQRAVVRATSEERVEALASLLWTYKEASFLPHGSAKDGFAEEQPVWLTAQEEAPNAPQVLFLTDGAAASGFDGLELCAVLFDGRDPEAVEAARDQWRGLKDQGHQVTYWQQDDTGRWAEKA